MKTNHNLYGTMTTISEQSVRQTPRLRLRNLTFLAVVAVLLAGSLPTHATAVGAAIGQPGSVVTLTAGPLMTTARMMHYNVELPDGRVALLGGHGTAFLVLNSMELWNPVNNSFTSVSMPYIFDGAALVHLADGRYLLAGSADNSGRAPGFNTAQILDPTTATVTAAGTTMIHSRMLCQGAQMTEGNVLIVGGWYDTASGTYGEVFNPSTSVFTTTGALNSPRANPYVFPTTDGKAVVAGGMGVRGTTGNQPVELYDPVSNTFSVLASSAIDGETDWVFTANLNGQDLTRRQIADGRYVFMMNRTVNSQTEYALAFFDPATKQFTKQTMTPEFWTNLSVWSPVLDQANNRLLFLAGTNLNSGANLTFRVYQVEFSTGEALPLSDDLTVADYYLGDVGLILLSDGRLFVTGGTTSVNAQYNFTPVRNTLFLSGPITQPPPQNSIIPGVFNGLINGFQMGNGTEGENMAALFASTGFISLTTKASGSFTGSLRLEGKNLPLNGKFVSGVATITIKRAGKSNVVVTLNFNSTAPGKITGTVTTGGTPMDFQALPGIYTGTKTSLHPLSGKHYTVILPAPDASLGHGYATLVFAANGKATLAGKLADGTPYTTTSRTV
ncbi:MAG: kelch repeat-containing protein, partial [Victivallales bacterium]